MKTVFFFSLLIIVLSFFISGCHSTQSKLHVSTGRNIQTIMLFNGSNQMAGINSSKALAGI